jgi:ABC-type Fe3+-citrate transport system substrate-binding protein
LFSIDIEQEARLDDHEERLAELEQALEQRETSHQREPRQDGGTQ